MKIYFYTLVIFFAFPFSAFAEDPSFQYINASASSINSNQIVSFTWRVSNGGGYSYMAPCIQGVVFFKADGTTLPCNTTIGSTWDATGGVDIMVRNLSSSPRAITLRVTPKDASGADYILGRQDLTVSVSPVIKPIDSISGPTVISSGAGYTLSWTASQISGVNLQISCSSIIQSTSPSYTSGNLPCNTPIFTSDRSPNSSLELKFNNNTTATSSITLTLLPAMDTGVYNGAGSESLTVEVVPNIIPDPTTVSFSMTPESLRVAYGSSISFSWVTENSDGVNFWFSCNENITPVITIGNATSTPKCNTLALENPLNTSGSVSVIFYNKNYTTEAVTITLIPKSKKGGFDATRGKQINLSVLPKSSTTVVETPFVTTPPLTSSSPAVANVIPGCSGASGYSTTTGQKCDRTTNITLQTKTSSFSPIFTKYLSRGISGSEVSLLQTYLKKDSAIYPEGLVTGYYGPATERAVKKLQQKYNIATTTTIGFGTVGPKTRAFLNSVAQ